MRRCSRSCPAQSAALASRRASRWSCSTPAACRQEQFDAARDKLLAAASANPKLTSVRLSELPDVASLKVNIDQQRVATLGLTLGDVNSTLSTAWGGRYVNDFIDRGRVKRVYVQGDAPYRAERRATSTNGSCATTRAAWCPSRSFAQTSWITTPTSSSRFLGYPSFEISGQGAPGVSSGDAMNIMEQLATQIPGISVAWAGQSYQERLSSGQAPILYGVALIVVFLCLAALYESWSIPVAVLLVIPLGLVGSIFFVTLRGTAERRLSSGRPDHDHGPVRQERDPDGRVRRARRARRASA